MKAQRKGKTSGNQRRNHSSTEVMTRLRARDPVLLQVQTTPGLASRIGEACGIVRSAVWNWKRVPAEHVLAVAKLLKIPRHCIRPDIYPSRNSALTKRWFNNANGQGEQGDG